MPLHAGACLYDNDNGIDNVTDIDNDNDIGQLRCKKREKRKNKKLLTSYKFINRLEVWEEMTDYTLPWGGVLFMIYSRCRRGGGSIKSPGGDLQSTAGALSAKPAVLRAMEPPLAVTAIFHKHQQIHLL